MIEPEVIRLEVEPREAVMLDWYPAPAPAAPAALFIPGFGSHRRGEKARYFAARCQAGGRSFASLDLRGHGTSGGSVRDLTMTRMLADTAVAAQWVAARSGKPGLLLIGASMGAAVAAWHAARRPETVARLVLIAPALDFPAGFVGALSPSEREQWRARGTRRFRSEWVDLELGYGLLQDAAGFDAASLAERLTTPALLIHGVRDGTIAWSQSVEFLRRRSHRPTDLYLVGDGDHRLTAHKELLFVVVSAWAGWSPDHAMSRVP